MRFRWVLPLLLLLPAALAGCSGSDPASLPGEPSSTTTTGTGAPSVDTPSTTVASTHAVPIECPSSCHEPTLARVGDELLVTVANAGPIVAAAGGQWENRTRPALPSAAPCCLVQGDGTLVVDPQGRLWYLALGLTGSQTPAGGAYVFAGIQVARSDDGARTWATNTWIGLDSPAHATAQAERPWLAFQQDMVHVAYPHWPASVFSQVRFVGVSDGLWMVTSHDDGQSFGTPARVSAVADRYGIAGRPLVADGTLYVPYHASSDTGASQVRVARSTDGVTFEQAVVPGSAGFRFHALQRDGSGTFWLAGVVDGTILVWQSPDAVDWSEPVEVQEGEAIVQPSPWMEVRPDGGVDLAWAEAGEEEDVIVLLRLPPGGPPEAGVRHAGFVAAGGAQTDFMQFVADGPVVWMPSGDFQSVWVTRYAAAWDTPVS